MTSIVLAFLSALVWGASDYSGGRATQRGTAVAVTVASQVLGLPLLAVGIWLLAGQPTPTDLIWGAGAGVVGLLGGVLLYASLSTGAMAVAAPITAVTGAVLPTGVGLALGETPGPIALIGSGCAAVAVALVSLGPGAGARAGGRVIALALSAGAMFGLLFVMLAQTTPTSGLWPLLAARASSVCLGLLLLIGQLLRRQSRWPRLPVRSLGWVALAGGGDILANALYLVAVRHGLLSLVAPIAALYPVSTVLLALGVDRERVRAVHLVGLGLAATALILTAV